MTDQIMDDINDLIFDAPHLDIDDELWWDRYVDHTTYILTGTEQEDYEEYLAQWVPDPDDEPIDYDMELQAYIDGGEW